MLKKKRNKSFNIFVTIASIAFTVFLLQGAKCGDSTGVSCEDGECTTTDEDGNKVSVSTTHTLCADMAKRIGCFATKEDIKDNTGEIVTCCENTGEKDLCIDLLSKLDMDEDGYSCVEDNDCNDANSSVWTVPGLFMLTTIEMATVLV